MSDTLGPLALTLEETMSVLLDEGMRFVYFGSTNWSVKDVATGHYRGTGPSWWTAASYALGRPVVARDDAAELRAELLEWKRHAYDRGEENALLYNENGILRALAIKYLNRYLEDFYIEEWTDKWPQDLYDDCAFLNQLPDDGALERDDG